MAEAFELATKRHIRKLKNKLKIENSEWNKTKGDVIRQGIKIMQKANIRSRNEYNLNECYM